MAGRVRPVANYDVEPGYRAATRVLLVDETDHVLLFCYPAAGVGDCFWVPPGGGLREGEDHETAARRELHEETGLAGAELQVLGWRRRVAFPWLGRFVRQDERWFLARCRRCEVDPAAVARVRDEGVTEARWWSPADIAASSAQFVPTRLAELLPDVLAGRFGGDVLDIEGGPAGAEAWADEIERRLAAAGDRERAEGEKRYLKSDLEHLGVRVPEIRRVARAVAGEAGIAGGTDVVALAAALWDRPVHERRAAAVEVLVHHRHLLDATHLGFVERLLREARTWALVDPLATNVAGSLFDAHPAAVGPILDRWSQDDDLWLRRSALLALLGGLRTGRGDFERFGRYADAMLDEKEFFIRKAIGWVLREAGKADPDRVDAWIAPRTDRASGVTMREAIKPLPPGRAEELMAAYREGRPAD